MFSPFRINIYQPWGQLGKDLIYQTFYSHLPTVQVFLWLAERDGEAAVESEGVGVLVVSQDIQGIGVLVASVGSWGVVARKAAAVKGGRMEAEGKCDSAPPMTLLCSAHHLPPGVREKPAQQSASRYIRDPLGRSPWNDLQGRQHTAANNEPQKTSPLYLSLRLWQHKILPECNSG